MADISVQQKKATNLTWIWAVVAIVAIIGLMLWLATQPPPTPVVTEAGTGAGPAAEAASVETVDLANLGAAPDQYLGRSVEVRAVPVAAVLGDRAFWADIPGANPFLVILGPEVQDLSWVSEGASATLQGEVEPVLESGVAEWVGNGTIRPGASDEVSFATHYLLVDRVQR